MITYIPTGSLFDSPAQVLVNPVNTVGVMGKGIARECKRKYPEMFRHYRELCQRGELSIGRLWLFKGPDRWILNFPTKDDWRRPSRVEYIEAGLQKFVDTYAALNITSIALPALGCGEGGLDFSSQVQPVMEHYLSPLPIAISVYLPHGNTYPPRR